MSTPYDKIYRRFLKKISDHDILMFDQYTQYQILLDLLLGACATFDRICKSDLEDRDDVILEFNGDLSSIEQEILATGMLCNWLEPKVNDTSKIAQFINTKDYYASSSPANLLAQARGILETNERKYRYLITQYSYAEGDIASLSIRS